MAAFTARLIVDAGHPAVRIEVLDGTYSVRAKGYGQLSEQLPTGLYTVRYAAGDAVRDRDITLRPDETLTLDEPPGLRFASAAPLEATWTSHEYHQHHAQLLSHGAPLELGRGGQLLVFMRDVDAGGRKNLAKGLSLHRLDGQMVLEFEGNVEDSSGSKEACWAGRCIALDPGVYRLRLALGRRAAAEMTVVVCPGWQSQLFLLRGGGNSQVAGRTVLDLPGATQLMAKPAEGFNPYVTTTGGRVTALDAAEDLRLAELATQALANGRMGIHTRDLQTMLDGKWQDPLLGILGVHLLLMREKPDLDLAEQVVRRLRYGILQGFRHPDVEILAAEVARLRNVPPDVPPLDGPPMLRRSWQMLVQATVAQPALVPPRSLCARVADRLWGAGAWLLWETPPEMPAQPQANSGVLGSAGTPGVVGEAYPPSADDQGKLESLLNSQDFRAVARALPRNHDEAVARLSALDFAALRAATSALLPHLAQSQDGLDVEALADQAKLDAAELALLSCFALPLSTHRRTRTTPQHDPLELSALVRQLGLPAGRVQRALASLFIKLVKLLARPSRPAK